MRSSYLNNLDYSDIFKSVLFNKQNNNALEIGILDGYSLQTIFNITNANINAYDIFDEFTELPVNKEYLRNKFKNNSNINIQY